MTPRRGLAVVVPAHDEADLVDACLDALAAALAPVTRPGLAVAVVVALDACRDATADRVAAHPLRPTAVVLDAGAVGAARAEGTARALRQLDLPPASVWTAHTDADSRVPGDWLSLALAAADDGADALLGTVVPGEGLRPEVRTLWHALHPPVGAGPHPHIHGANLGVRASALAAVGGWRPLRTDEDVDLVDRLRAHRGLDVRTTTAAPVVTSAREHGHAPDGFARYLRHLGAAAAVGEGLTTEAG